MLRTEFGARMVKELLGRSTSACLPDAVSLANQQLPFTDQGRRTAVCGALAQDGAPHRVFGGVARALIEVLAHLEMDETDWPRSYQLLQAEIPAKLPRVTLDPAKIKNWQADPAVTRRLGDDWLRSGSSALARVPSAILPEMWNVLLNPDHEEASRISIVKVRLAAYDPTLVHPGMKPE